MPLSPTSQTAFADAVDLFDACVRSTPSDAWDRPSPCEGWSAADVLTHCATNLRALVGAANGVDFIEGSGRPAPDDVVAAWPAIAADAKELVASGDLDTIVLGGRDVPAAGLVDGLMRDLVIHTWDVNQAVGAETRIAAPLVAAAIEAMKAVGPNMRRPGMYGEDLTPPDGADDLTALLASSGRRAW